MSDFLPKTTKSLGQHWLTDQSILQAICEAAELTPDNMVLEIGSGPGTLTKLLASRVHQVVAVEFDHDLARQLASSTVDNVTVVEKDILKFDLRTLPQEYIVVANIPYYITSKLIRVLSETVNPPERAIILVQKEVAERVCAKPGSMSLLSVSAQYYWEASLDIVVPAKLFTPPPKVDSQLLVMKRRQEPLFGAGVDSKQFFRLVKAGFSARRKTLQNSLAGGLRISREAAEQLLRKAQLSPTARPQELSLGDWYQLYVQYRMLPESAHSPALA